jgi:Tfp pilus assembly protein PilF
MGLIRRENLSGFIALILFTATLVFVFYWRTGVEDTPGDYNVKKGNYRLEDGLYADAIKEFRQALQKNPEHLDAHLGMALAYMQMGEYKKALSYFNRAIELDPSFAVAYADRGIMYDRMGKFRLALQDYRKAIELEPKIAEGPGWIWRLLHTAGKKPSTIADRARYIEAELRKPPEERLLRKPDVDSQQKMYKY